MALESFDMRVQKIDSDAELVIAEMSLTVAKRR
jgi:hypothetical protein